MSNRDSIQEKYFQRSLVTIILFFLITSLALSACSVEKRAERFLEKINDPERSEEDIATDIIELIELGEEAIPTIISAYQDPIYVDSLGYITQAMNALWNNAISNTVISSLKNPLSNDQLLMSIDMLGEHNVTEAAEELTKAFWKHEYAQDEIWFLLLDLNDPIAINIALEMLERSQHGSNRKLQEAKELVIKSFLVEHSVQSLSVLVERLLTYDYLQEVVHDYSGKINEFPKEDMGIASQITEALTDIGEDSVPELSANLSEVNQSSNTLLFQVIYNIGGTAAVDAIFESLDSPSEAVLTPAMHAFWVILDEEKTIEHNRAQELINQNPETIINHLDTSNETIKVDAVKILSKSSNSAAINALYNEVKNPNPEIYTAAIQSLAENQDDRAYEGLQYLLLNYSGLDLDFILNSYALIDADPLPVLKEIIENSEETEILVQAIRAVGMTGSSEMVDSLTNLLEVENQEIRLAVISAFEQIKDPTTLPVIIPFLGDENSEVKYAAIKTLGSLEDPQALPYLESIYYSSTDETERGHVINAVGEIGGEGTIEILRIALGDPNPSIQKSTAYYLNKLPEEQLDFVFISLDSVNKYLKTPDTLDQTQRATIKQHELRIVALFHKLLIKKGDPTSIDALAWALRIYGDKSMAVVYLNCGNESLEDAARDWAKDNGYIVTTFPSVGGSGGTGWGSAK